MSPLLEYRVNSQSGLQARPEKNSAARAQCRVQPEAVCRSHHEDSGAEDDGAHIRLGQDGVHRRKVRGRLETCRKEVRENRAEAGFPGQTNFRNSYHYYAVSLLLFGWVSYWGIQFHKISI